MEALRDAMQKEGPDAGNIKLKVARRILPQLPGGAKPEFQGPRELRVSRSEPSPEVEYGNITTSGETRAIDVGPEPPMKLKNPLLDRLSVNAHAGHVRNTSYQRATHDSMNDTASSIATDIDTQPPQNSRAFVTKTEEIHMADGDTYHIEMVP